MLIAIFLVVLVGTVVVNVFSDAKAPKKTNAKKASAAPDVVTGIASIFDIFN